VVCVCWLVLIWILDYWLKCVVLLYEVVGWVYLVASCGVVFATIFVGTKQYLARI
jgi:hypothetical protein